MIRNKKAAHFVDLSCPYLHVAIDQPIELEIFVIVSKRVNELFCDFEQTHVKEELKDGIDWNVEIDVHGYTTAPHGLTFFQGINLLPTDHAKNKEHISS